MSKVWRYESDPTAGDADDWDAFVAEMGSGRVFECDEAMYYHWLEVLPPAWLNRKLQIPGVGERTTFGFAEGREEVVAFWRENGRFFGWQTGIMNPDPFG